MQPGWCQPVRQEFMENECEALPGVAYPGVRDNRNTINTKTGYDDDTHYSLVVLKVPLNTNQPNMLSSHDHCQTQVSKNTFFLFHLLSTTSKPLSTRLAHAARLGFFYKNALYKFTVTYIHTNVRDNFHLW